MDYWNHVNLSSETFYSLEEDERKKVLEHLHHFIHEHNKGDEDYHDFLIGMQKIKKQLFLNDHAMRFLAIKKLEEFEEGK